VVKKMLEKGHEIQQTFRKQDASSFRNDWEKKKKRGANLAKSRRRQKEKKERGGASQKKAPVSRGKNPFPYNAKQVKRETALSGVSTHTSKRCNLRKKEGKKCKKPGVGCLIRNIRKNCRDDNRTSRVKKKERTEKLSQAKKREKKEICVYVGRNTCPAIASRFGIRMRQKKKGARPSQKNEEKMERRPVPQAR